MNYDCTECRYEDRDASENPCRSCCYGDNDLSEPKISEKDTVVLESINTKLNAIMEHLGIVG